MAANGLGPMGGQGTNRGGGRVEHGDLVPLHHVPVAARVGVGGNGLEHEGGGAVGQRPVHDVAVAGDPAHVGHAGEHVVLAKIEGGLAGPRGPQEVATAGVHQPLRLARRAAGVEDEQRVFGPELHGVVGVASVGHHVLPPHVAALHPPHVAAGVPVDERVLHRVEARHRLVGHVLQRDGAPAAAALVLGDDQLGAAVDDAVAQAVGGEASEHHRVNRPHPRTGEHRDGCLGHHAHVDDDAVAGLDTEVGQRVRGAAHLPVELAVGELAHGARLVALPEDGHLVAAGAQVAVEARLRDVEATVGEPGERLVLDRVVVADEALGGGAAPRQAAARLVEPEAGGIRRRPVPGLAVVGHAGHGARRVGRDALGDGVEIGHDSSRVQGSRGYAEGTDPTTEPP